MTASSWTAAPEPGNCAMCGARYEAGHRVRRNPDAGGMVDAVCGRDPEEEGILGQLGLGEDENPL